MSGIIVTDQIIPIYVDIHTKHPVNAFLALENMCYIGGSRCYVAAVALYKMKMVFCLYHPHFAHPIFIKSKGFLHNT